MLYRILVLAGGVALACGETDSAGGGTGGANRGGNANGGSGGARPSGGTSAAGASDEAGAPTQNGGAPGDAGSTSTPGAGAGAEASQGGSAGSLSNGGSAEGGEPAAGGAQGSCDDRVKNQTETDIDCGGVCKDSPCEAGNACKQGSDCASYLCTNAVCEAAPQIPAADVIDDLEDSDLELPRAGGRAGRWFAFHDGTSGISGMEVAALEPARAQSQVGIHYMARDFSAWGSGFGFEFKNSSSGTATRELWDGSGYAGIVFWAKAAKPTSVSVLVPDRNTDQTAGVCTICDHHWYKSLSLGLDWRRYTVTFDELILEPGGAPVPTAFDKTGMAMLQFLFAPEEDVDVWVDDVSLLK